MFKLLKRMWTISLDSIAIFILALFVVLMYRILEVVYQTEMGSAIIIASGTILAIIWSFVRIIKVLKG